VTSSVITLKRASVHGPNEVTIAASVASHPASHQDSADPRCVVARTEGIPESTEADFEPGAEVNR